MQFQVKHQLSTSIIMTIQNDMHVIKHFETSDTILTSWKYLDIPITQYKLSERVQL